MQQRCLQHRALANGSAMLVRTQRSGWQAHAPSRQRQLVLLASATPPGHSTASSRASLVFLGTPEVAAIVLKELVEASRKPGATFEVVAVVSQPGKPRGRGNKATPLPTPVEEQARALGMQPLAPRDSSSTHAEQQQQQQQGVIMCPATARDPSFLAALRALEPDLCITAAYGNMLPQTFLDLPKLGTLNIHPSLLPKYRGAAPVQRCLQAGDAIGGVSVAYTVLACDAGPVLAQQQVPLDPNIQAPELLELLFRQGVQLLLAHMPDVLAGKGSGMARAQDPQQATHAAKLRKEEALLDLTSCSAATLHNAVRGLAGWPGTLARVELVDDSTGAREGPLDLRILRTQSPTQADLDTYLSSTSLLELGLEAAWATDGTGDLLLPCCFTEADQQGIGAQAGAGHASAGGSKRSVLRVTTVQPPTKKALAAKDFRNGLRKKRLVLHVPAAGQAGVTGKEGALAAAPAGAGSLA